MQAFQKTSAPLGTAIIGSVLSAAYVAHLELARLSATQAATVRSSVYDGVTIANQLHSPSLAAQVRGAFVHGLNVSLLISAGIAASGVIVTLVLLPGVRPQPGQRSPSREIDHAQQP